MLATSSFYFHSIQSSNLPPTPLESCMGAGTHQFDGPNHLHPLNLYLDMSHIVHLIFKLLPFGPPGPTQQCTPLAASPPGKQDRPPESKSSPFDIGAKGVTPEPRGPPLRTGPLGPTVEYLLVSFRIQLRVSELKREKIFSVQYKD